MVEEVELARHYRANAVCITAPATDLARASDVRLTVAVPEYPDTLKPTALALCLPGVIDLLAVATGYKIDGPARETLRRIKYNIQTYRAGSEMEPRGGLRGDASNDRRHAAVD